MRHRFWALLRHYGKADVKVKEKEEGHFSDETGEWVEGEVTEIPIRPAAVLPLSDDELSHDGGGTFTTNDRKLICYREITKGQEVIANGKEYTIFGRKDWDDYASILNVYVLRRSGESDD